MSLLDFLILACCAWQAAYFITSENGPWDIAARFRSRYRLGGLTSCWKCALMWTALASFLLWRFGGEVGQAAVMVGAIRGAAIMLASYSGAAHS